MTALFAVATLAALGVLLAAETGHPRWRAPAKLTASTGFLGVAVAAGAFDAGFGRMIFVALCFSWLGDAFLLSEQRRWFLAGLAAFLVAHLSYGAAFIIRGLSATGIVVGGVLVVVAGAPIFRYLRPHIIGRLRGPVHAYIGVISFMVTLAIGTTGFQTDIRIPLGATAFYASDVFVARRRFVAESPLDRLVGLPLYYGAQLLLAWASGG